MSKADGFESQGKTSLFFLKNLVDNEMKINVAMFIFTFQKKALGIWDLRKTSRLEGFSPISLVNLL